MTSGMTRLSSERLSFRPLCANDLSFMLTLTGNPDVVRYLPGMITDEAMMRGWLASLSSEDNEFLIVLRDTNAPIGECSLTLREEEGSCEIGYMLLPQYWNQGYGTETARWLMLAAEVLGVQKVTAMTHAQNGASVRILQKLGFQKYTVGWMLIDTPDGMKDSQMDGYVYEKKEE